MSGVGAFVHLYHIWGLFGLLTASLFGVQAYREWRKHGGTWRKAPGEWAYTLGWFFREALLDVGRFGKWAAMSFAGVPFNWGESPWQARKYTRQQVILIGITFGGMSRFLTALYWSEKNREWMNYAESWTIQMASAFVIMAIIGDLHHHMTAWPDKRHRVRLIVLVSLAWILFGTIRG